MQYLEYLDLTNNYITTISPEAFKDLLWLKILYLGKNFLSEIRGNMWVGLQFLEELSIYESHITDIPRHGISLNPALEKLWLSSNQLRTLRSDMFN